MGATGPQGDPGPPGSASWVYYASEFSLTPEVHPDAPVAGGIVYTYINGASTLYRHVPSPYDPTQDTFYETYSAGVLSSPLISRA
jgi:hypothetical protein